MQQSEGGESLYLAYEKENVATEFGDLPAKEVSFQSLEKNATFTSFH